MDLTPQGFWAIMVAVSGFALLMKLVIVLAK